MVRLELEVGGGYLMERSVDIRVELVRLVGLEGMLVRLSIVVDGMEV